jgi:hypothetical protein
MLNSMPIIRDRHLQRRCGGEFFSIYFKLEGNFIPGASKYNIPTQAWRNADRAAYLANRRFQPVQTAILQPSLLILPPFRPCHDVCRHHSMLISNIELCFEMQLL